jgi:lipopolysaccharide export LptBFGC system permease protein LptF
VVLAVAAPGIWWLIAATSDEAGAEVAGALVALILPVLLVSFVLAFVDLFLTDFVVPIMYRQRLKTTAAWRVFLPRLREHLGALVLYGLFVLGLHILVFVVIFAVSIWTCCIPFLILMIPVLGTVVLLPLHVTYRIFSLELLSQLGSDLGPLPPSPRTGEEPESPPKAASETGLGAG